MRRVFLGRGFAWPPRALRGRGIASELVQGALQLIRADGLKVVAGCGFVVDYLHKHPEFSDLAG